jgi:hypothetical protein
MSNLLNFILTTYIKKLEHYNNQIMDMLFITINGRSTRFWGKLGEGFFS